MAITDLFLTPKNVQRGVNFLKNNQGIVNTLTGLPIGSSAGRAFFRNLSGSTEPITEDFFSSNQLAEIKRRTAEQMAKFSMPDSDSWQKRNKVVNYNLDNPIDVRGVLSNPVTDIDATLGTYTYKQNPDGTISAIDKHDFDSIGGGVEIYGKDQGKKLGEFTTLTPPTGTPQYLGERGLPFLPPVDPYGRTEAQATAEDVIKDPFTGEIMKPLKDQEYVTQTESMFDSKENTLKKVFDAYKKGHMSSGNFARIIGGIYGIQGKEEDDYYPEHSLMRENWGEKGIPVNINMGKISQLDKLKANKNFARYIANTQTIPSKIRKQAAKHAGPVSTSPINVGNPFGYGRRKPDPPRGGRGDRDNTGRNEPGGGRGQSPTGGDISGTPFFKGGIVSVL